MSKQTEEVSEKLSLYINKSIEDAQPTINKLLTKLSAWLDKKLAT